MARKEVRERMAEAGQDKKFETGEFSTHLTCFSLTEPSNKALGISPSYVLSPFYSKWVNFNVFVTTFFTASFSHCKQQRKQTI